MKHSESLLVIIVTFNSESQIISCLDRISKSKVRQINEIKIVVVDNLSTDGTVSLVRTRYTDLIKDNRLIIVENNENLGFAKAVNLCIKKYRHDYYLLLNPDIFVESDTVDLVVAHSKRTNSDIVGLSTKNQKGEKTGSYFRFPNLWVGIFDFTNARKLLRGDFWHNYFYYKDLRSQPVVVDVVTGGFMLIKRTVIDSIGMFSESFFMYLEDVDFCLRSGRAGFKTSVANATLTHIGGASSRNKDKINHRAWITSRKKYFLKNHSFFENLLIQPLFLVDDIIIITGRLFSYDHKNN